MQMLNGKTPGGSRVIDIRSFFPARYVPEKVLGLAKLPPDEFMAPHLVKMRRGQGDGLYCVRIYDETGHPNAFMSGVISERATGDPIQARQNHQTELASELGVFYETKARAEVKGPEDICILRKGYMSFLAVKCEAGIIVSGWYDTKSKVSANGIHMLAFTIYALGTLNSQEDAVLKDAAIKYLPFAEGVVGDFDLAAIQAELVRLARKFGTSFGNV